MAMISCPECGGQISDKAPKCIHCGYVLQPEPKEKTPISFSAIKKPLIITGAILICILMAVAIYFTNFTVSAKYDKANRAYDRGNYAKAVNYYTAVGDYKDAPSKLVEATVLYNYTSAKSAIEKGEWQEAKGFLSNCEGYEDAGALIKQADYNIAVAMMEENDYESAKILLSGVGGYGDSTDKLHECDYNIALKQQESGDYLSAAKGYKAASGYSDSNARIIAMGEELVDKGEYANAYDVFCEYPDQNALASNSYAKYAEGQSYYEKQNYLLAAPAFQAAGEFLDAEELYMESSYNQAVSRFKARDYDVAKTWFGKVRGYKDSDNLRSGCVVLEIKDMIEEGNLHAAQKALEDLDGEFSYEGYSTSGFKELLDNNAKWVNLCGKWTSTGGQMRSTQSGSYYDYWWYRDFEEGNENLEVRIGLLGDGTAKVKIVGKIDVYTSYSSLQALVETGKVDVTTYKEMTGLGTIKIDDYTSITLGDSKITVNYKKTDRTQDVYFTYIYKTDVTYGKRVADY